MNTSVREQLLGCLICGGAYRPSHLPGLFSCERCGFISADLSISDETLKRLYGLNYFHGGEYGNYLDDEDALKLNFRDRISDLRKIVPQFEGCSLFEIGCAYGIFLELVAPLVRHAAGIDISEDAACHARDVRKVDAHGGDYFQYTMPHPTDIVVLWDTIEHLKRPDLFVAKIARDLKPGGFIALTTGDIGSFNARLRGRRWRMIHPPTHLHYFSVPTMTHLLNRHGFEVVHISHPGYTRLIRYVLYILLVREWKFNRAYNVIEKWRISDLPFTLNLWDIMFVVARKVS
jgi:2-polyprenyl-3-methyl-5-hydroxy-6-metoxy-1,4-benzoquinol methylase